MCRDSKFFHYDPAVWQGVRLHSLSLSLSLSVSVCLSLSLSLRLFLCLSVSVSFSVSPKQNKNKQQPPNNNNKKKSWDKVDCQLSENRLKKDTREYKGKQASKKEKQILARRHPLIMQTHLARSSSKHFLGVLVANADYSNSLQFVKETETRSHCVK